MTTKTVTTGDCLWRFLMFLWCSGSSKLGMVTGATLYQILPAVSSALYFCRKRPERKLLLCLSFRYYTHCMAWELKGVAHPVHQLCLTQQIYIFRSYIHDEKTSLNLDLFTFQLYGPLIPLVIMSWYSPNILIPLPTVRQLTRNTHRAPRLLTCHHVNLGVRLNNTWRHIPRRRTASSCRKLYDCALRRCVPVRNGSWDLVREVAEWVPWAFFPGDSTSRIRISVSYVSYLRKYQAMFWIELHHSG